MIKLMEMPTFLRNFKVMNNGDIDLFLGSGASVQAGIPTGAGLVWEFKREIYCTETEVSKEKFKDLHLFIHNNSYKVILIIKEFILHNMTLVNTRIILNCVTIQM